MNADEARQIATAEIEAARGLSAAVPHPPSEHRARLARIILDLCSQLDARDAVANEDPPARHPDDPLKWVVPPAKPKARK